MYQTPRPTRRAPTAALLVLLVHLLSGCGEVADGAAPEGTDPNHRAERAASTPRREDRPPDVLARLADTGVTSPPTTATAPATAPTTAPTAGPTVTEPTPANEPAVTPAPASVTEPAPTPEADSPQPQPEPPPIGPPPDEQPPPTTDPRSKVGYFIEMTNQLRSGLGLAPFQLSGSLAHSAGLQAEHMAATNTLAHQDLQDELGQGWMLVGENVGYGPSAESVFQALVSSPGHYANMTSSGFTHAGMATRWDDAGRLWVAQVFGG